MYDIATSKYKQLQQIRNIHISEADEEEKQNKFEPPKKRMIQLRLTDGLQDVIGIEYNYIPRLNFLLQDTLLPGYKIMIIGPVKCRKGVLLLEDGKLKGIGGEVDSLLIPNALENVLARALKLQENSDPYNDNESKSNNVKQQKEPNIDDSFFEDDFEINLEEVSKIEHLHSKDHKQPNINTTKTQIKTVNLINTSTVQKKDHNSKEKIILDDDDCFLEMVDEEQFVQSRTEQTNIAAPFRALPKEEDDDDIIVINDDLEPAERKERISNYDSAITNKTAPSTNIACPRVCKTIEKTHLTPIGGKRPVPMSPPETVTKKRGKIDRKITDFVKAPNSPDIPKICEFIHDVNNEVITEITYRTIRGRVEEHGRLGKKDSCWILDATLVDGTGKIDVSFSNKVLENLLGFSVQEFSLKKKLKKNPEIEQELRKNFRTAEQKIKTLDALLELELNINKKPTVIKIADLTQEQKELIDKRLKNF
ncbi:recQ-mediated genome instability protein 1-like isoform X3 [Colletes gigas]|nr:recQ-mediated genome instability protein 1-like isoform X3 [Colletes gigas]